MLIDYEMGGGRFRIKVVMGSIKSITELVRYTDVSF
ncbi:hypothetical protein M7I_0626 [Glarea lozoyensis 74030]|uniref:Uncharacterized protein n=1 Tax=Glarea lozoyensis (strain ATCC 74030 / MF5533) TaxID=1104152 RepID=H0EDH7_GLAL7|nr:hypothetical protein M7I_0626 [Glarea lozoyensis 74030]